MSQDGLFFKQAATLNSNAVPARALWAQAVWACALCLSGTYGDLLNYTTFASLLFYILTIGGLFVLRQREPDAPRPYKALGYPVLPIIYILVAGAICVNLLIMQPKQAGMGLLIVLLGVPIFFLFEKMREK
jgi:APA family basic amino acid/polyamine antiporter